MVQQAEVFVIQQQSFHVVTLRHRQHTLLQDAGDVKHRGNLRPSKTNTKREVKKIIKFVKLKNIFSTYLMERLNRKEVFQPVQEVPHQLLKVFIVHGPKL